MKLLAFAVSSIALGAAVASDAAAQTTYERARERAEVPFLAQAGAGGRGGSGGGVDSSSGVKAVNRNAPYVTHVRSSTPPPLDPTRRVYEVDCTRPFDALGKGNLRCM